MKERDERHVPWGAVRHRVARTGLPECIVLAPMVCQGPRLIMGEVIPGVAVLAVVLTDRAPLPLGQVGPPLLPGDARLAGLVAGSGGRQRGMESQPGPG